MSAWTAAHSAALLQRPVLGVNFHAVSAENRVEVTGRLRLAAQLGASLDPDDDQDGAPKLFVAFYDGYRETGLFGAELCANLGIRAYYFPIFSSLDPERAQLSDADLEQIATVHELCFHTTSHLAAEEVTPQNVAREVREPVERIRSITGTVPRLSAWRGGARFDEQALGDRVLRELGVRHRVSNWSIERIPNAGA